MIDKDFRTFTVYALIGLTLLSGSYQSISQELIIGATYNQVFSIKEDGSDFKVLRDFTGFGDTGGELTYHDGRFWGTVVAGGAHLNGLIFSVNQEGKDFQIEHNLLRQDDDWFFAGIRPTGQLVFSKGKMWGITTILGGNSRGVFYSFDPSTGTYEETFHFDDTFFPVSGSEVYLFDNEFWVINSSQIAVLDENGTDLTVVHEFTTETGVSPNFKVTEVGDDVYGVCHSGAEDDEGAIFKINKTSKEYTVLYEFDNHRNTGDDAIYDIRASQPVYFTDGKLWGVVRLRDSASGSPYYVIYSIDLDGQNFQEVISGSNSFLLEGSLLIDGISKLSFQGETRFGRAIYTYAPSSNSIDSLFSIGDNSLRGDFKLVENSMLGIVAPPITSERDYIVSFDLSNNEFEETFEFINPNGEGLNTKVISVDGKLYGTTRFGGASNFGSVYEMDLNGENFRLLHSFLGAEGGAYPSGGLAHIDSKLWGVTDDGWQSASQPENNGTIYKLDIDGDNFDVVHYFENSSDPGAESDPVGELVEVDDRIYGTTMSGGAIRRGVLYSVLANGTDYKVEDVNSIISEGDILFADGQLFTYGMANTTPSYSYFSIQAGDQRNCSLFADAGPPEGIATLGDSLFFVTSGRGDIGTFRSVDHKSVTESGCSSAFQEVEFTFDTSIGSFPSSLSRYGSRFFFSTEEGGDHNNGTLYSYDIASKEGSVLHHFKPSDGVPLKGTMSILVLEGLNNAPVIAAQSFTIDENSAAGTVVGQLEASDVDGDELTYAILSGNSDNAFALSTSGELSVETVSALDYETTPSFSLEVEVSDGNGGSAQATITVDLNDVDERTNTDPVIVAQSFTIDENSAAGTVVGQLEASDVDGDELTYAILSGNSDNAFALSTSGELSVETVSALDYETTLSFSLEVEVSDGNGGSAQATVTVSLANLDETELLTNLFEVPENSAAGTVIGSVGNFESGSAFFPYLESNGNAIDQNDEAQVLGLELINNGALALSSDFELVLSTSDALDYESFQSFKITVKLCCFTGGSEPAVIITVNIINVNEETTMEDQLFTIDENSTSETVVGQVEASDEDGDVLAFSILSGNTDEAFSLSASGELSVQNATVLDFETIPTFRLEVQANDGVGGVATATITVDLNDLDEEEPLSADFGSDVEIYPNPSNTGKFTIKAYQLQGTKATLVDFSGRRLQEFILLENETVADIHHLPSGTYILKLGNKSFKITKAE